MNSATQLALPGADKNQHLANKAAGAGSPTDASIMNMKNTYTRHHLGDTAIGADFAGMEPVIDNADTEEQSRRNKPVADHLEHRPSHALLGQCENSDGHETHMRHR